MNKIRIKIIIKADVRQLMRVKQDLIEHLDGVDLASVVWIFNIIMPNPLEWNKWNQKIVRWAKKCNWFDIKYIY